MSAARKCTATIDHSVTLRGPASVAVIGGGIAGLATALAFARNGAEVFVFEQASEIGEVGAGLQVTPNGARALGWLGLADGLAGIGLAADAVVPGDALTGRAVTRFSLVGQRPRYRFVHRADLIGLMHSACTSAGVTVQTRARFGPDDPLPEAQLVIGADGIRSVLRPRLNGSGAPFFTGQVAWRAIIKADHPAEARIWMAPGRHLVSYPLRGGQVNIVAVEERADWAEEGWNHPDDPAQMRAAFSGCAPEVSALLDKVDQTHLWGLFRHDVAPVWQDGRSVLVGDAAHPTLPFLAQGANLALEDAVSLAVLVGAQGQAEGLRRYEAHRRARTTRAIAAANANAAHYHLRGIRRRIAHAGLAAVGRIAPAAFIGRLGWLYGYDAARDCLDVSS